MLTSTTRIAHTTINETGDPDPHGGDTIDDADEVLDSSHVHAAPDTFPRLWNASAAFVYQAVLRATAPEPPEYLTIPLRPHAGDDKRLALSLGVAHWNLAWEAAQFRRRMFDEDELPSPIRRVADQGDVNVMFVPRTRSRYYEYAPLFHLLPRTMLERFGLPLLRGGQWPFLATTTDQDRLLPNDFLNRLERAWAALVWRHLDSGSAMRGFSREDPVRLLAHNLDFWVPPVTRVIQDVLSDLPESNKGVEPAVPQLVDGSVLDEALIVNPRVGADVWCGEEEAAGIVRRTVDAADRDGRLRGILDAVRSNRVVDDFSDHWSFAREDFERKLHRKRNRVRVRFVELTDNIPVQGPETEVIDGLVTADFLALLNSRDREVVILLSSGVTKLTEIAEIMGYANHSAVSKRLTRIRKQAATHFNID
nr:sigma-70 family RNA polymerase sigma factor [Kineosporia sp. R_H_3]